MGLFDFMKVCLFSEVKGVVTLEGKPVSGAKIVRTAEINNKVYTDKTMTDENGKFHFDAMYTHSINKVMFIIEPVIPQTMIISHAENVYIGWSTVKRDYEVNTEFKDNKEIILSCELIDEKSKKEQNLRVPVVGICKF